MEEKNSTLSNLEEFKSLTKDVVGDVVDLLKTVDACHETSAYLEKTLTAIIDTSGGIPSTNEEDKIKEFRKSALELIIKTKESTSSQADKTLKGLDRFLRYLTDTDKEIQYVPGEFNEPVFETYKKHRNKSYYYKEHDDTKRIVVENNSLKSRENFLNQEIESLKKNLKKVEIERQKLETQITEMECNFEIYKTKKAKDTESQIMNILKQVNKMNLNEEVKELHNVYLQIEDDRQRLNFCPHDYGHSNENAVDKINHLSETSCENYTSLTVYKNDLSCQQAIDIEKNDQHQKHEDEKVNGDDFMNSKYEEFKSNQDNLNTLAKQLRETFSAYGHNTKLLVKERDKKKTKNKELKLQLDDLTKIAFKNEKDSERLTTEKDIELQKRKGLEDELSAIKEKKETLWKQLNGLQLELNNEKTERSKDIQTRDKEISDLRSELEERKTDIKELNTKLNNANQNFKDKTNENERELNRMNDLHQEEHAERGKLETQISHLQKEIGERNEQIEKWHGQIDGLTKIASKYEKDSERLTAEKDIEIQKRKGVEEELSAIKEKKETLWKQFIELQLELNNETTERCKDIQTRDKEISDLRSELEERKTDIKELNTKLNNANQKFKDKTNETERELNRMNDLHQEEHVERGKLETQISHLQKEIGERNEQIEKWHGQIDGLTKIASKYEKDSERLTAEKDIEIQKREGVEDELSAIKENKESLSKQFNELQLELNNEKIEHSKDIQTRDKEISDLRAELKERKTDIKELNTKLDHAYQIFIDKTNENENKFKTMNDLHQEERAERGKLETQISHLEKEIRERNEQIEKWHGQIDGLTKIASKYEKDSERLTAEKDIEIQRRKCVEDELSTIKENKESLSKQFNELQLELNNEKVEHSKDIQTSDKEISDLRAELEERKTDIKNLKAKIEETQHVLDDKTKEYDDKFKRMNHTHQKELTERGKLETKISYLEDEIKEKNKQFREWNSRLDGLTKIASKYETDSTILEKERDAEKQKRQKLEKELSDHIKAKEALSTEIANIQSTMIEQQQTHQNAVKSRDDDITSLGEQLKKKTKEVEESHLRINEMDNKKINMEQEIESLKHNRNQLEEQIQKLNNIIKDEKEKFESETNSLKNENQRLLRQTDMVRSDLKAKIKESLTETNNLRHKLQQKEHDLKEIKTLAEKTQKNMTDDFRKQKEAYAIEISDFKDKVNTLKKRLDEKESIRQSQDIEIKQLNSDKWKLIDDLKRLKAEYETIRKELETIKSRKIIQVQLYCQSGVGLLSSVEDELKCVLKSKFDVEESVDMDIIDCAKPSDINSDIPLLILCIQASRLGTAVTTTVQGLNLTQKMAVLIFHHKDIHALPSQASDRVLTQPELRNLGGIFDLAFLSGKGMYECDMNRVNFISLTNFIKREGTKRLKDDL